jgi:hypothetical protein
LSQKIRTRKIDHRRSNTESSIVQNSSNYIAAHERYHISYAEDWQMGTVNRVVEFSGNGVNEKRTKREISLLKKEDKMVETKKSSFSTKEKKRVSQSHKRNSRSKFMISPSRNILV